MDQLTKAFLEGFKAEQTARVAADKPARKAKRKVRKPEIDQFAERTVRRMLENPKR
jgi:hypothetical protein